MLWLIYVKLNGSIAVELELKSHLFEVMKLIYDSNSNESKMNEYYYYSVRFHFMFVLFN